MMIPGVDVSRYQGNMDWQKCAANGAKFAVCRATVGDYYTDTAYAANVTGITLAGLALGVYHVVTPCDNTGRTITAEMQMGYLFKAIQGVPLDLPIVLDCELDRGAAPSAMTELIQRCVGTILGKRTIHPIIYTSAGWWNPHVWRGPMWKSCPLWVANYTTAAKPLLPADWSTWVFWQWSADGNGQGPAYGAQSASIDLNRFDTVTGAIHGITIGEVKPPELPEYVYTREAINVREGATTASKSKAVTRKGSTWRVIGSGHDETGRLWYQIAEAAYIASWLCEAV